VKFTKSRVAVAVAEKLALFCVIHTNIHNKWEPCKFKDIDGFHGRLSPDLLVPFSIPGWHLAPHLGTHQYSLRIREIETSFEFVKSDCAGEIDFSPRDMTEIVLDRWHLFRDVG
jgi:hypothetical protein